MRVLDNNKSIQLVINDKFHICIKNPKGEKI
jgi:hypothetical protein